MVLSPFIIGTVSMTRRFDSLVLGMTYDEVIAIMGEPKNTHSVDDMLVCTWRKTPISGLYIIRTAYFKDKILHSVSYDKTYT